MIKALLLLLKAGKLGKVLLSGGTMLLSVIAYSWIFGWWYAVGFVALIFVHEMGHYVAARQRGLAGGRGAAGGGPGAPFPCFYLARNYDSQLLLALAYAGFFLNLFNLIPLSPFDGGRVTAVISPKLWLVGVPILVGLFFYRPSPLLILLAALAAPQAWKAWKALRGEQTDEEQAYYLASAETRFSYGALY